jgi:hypothetical protein
MNRISRFLPLTLFILLLAVASVQASDFQKAKVVALEKMDTKPKGGTDAPLASHTKTYRMELELGDTVYTCRAEVHGDFDLEALQGKEVDAKVQGKTVLVKRGNKIFKYPILTKKKAGM